MQCNGVLCVYRIFFIEFYIEQPEVIIETTGRILLKSLNAGESEDDLDVVSQSGEEFHHPVIVGLALDKLLPKFFLSRSIVRAEVLFAVENVYPCSLDISSYLYTLLMTMTQCLWRDLS